ncbi:MAG: glycosyltransferase [Myxococcales bacterium]|nr:glycosyltransferase [Myxococcales bacterium]
MSDSISSSDERPDLAIFIPSYAAGGAERVALLMARALAERGLRVDLVVSCAHGGLRDEELPGVNKVELGAINELLATPRWIRYLKRARPRCAMSLIHTANIASGIGRYVVRDVPVIVSQHYALRCEPEAQWWFRRWLGFGPERFAYRHVERVTGCSQGVADDAAEVFGLPPRRVLALPNPRHSRTASLELTPEQEPIFDKPVLLAVGRLTPQKDFAMLLRAFAGLSSRRDLHLVILGEGPERASLEAAARDLGVADRVFLVGFVDNAEAFMRRARVFVMSSRNEGLPMVLIEALGAGTAIVSTDCHFGPRELLDGGRLGRLTPVQDADALAAAIEAELDEPDLDHESRRADRADWLRRFDLDVITDQYADLVQEVIQESSGAALPGRG